MTQSNRRAQIYRGKYYRIWHEIIRRQRKTVNGTDVQLKLLKILIAQIGYVPE